MIEYDYIVSHRSWEIKPGREERIIRALKSIANAKTPHQAFGNSLRQNKEWEIAGLPKPTKLDRARSDNNPSMPSNLYTGTELFGALQGLDYLLDNQTRAPQKSKATHIMLSLGGTAERRSWWNGAPGASLDTVTGVPIKLPTSLGGDDITTSGLFALEDGGIKTIINNDGTSPWKDTIQAISASLLELSTDQDHKLKTKFFERTNSEGPRSTALSCSHLFNPSKEEWGHKSILDNHSPPQCDSILL